MQGLMQDWPLTVDRILDHARCWHPHREIVSRSVEGAIVRSTYGSVFNRAKQVSNALLDFGVQNGDRIATMAWNTANHMECWYGVMGIGAICHTLNPRLFNEQLLYIINHAEDRLIFADLTFVPQLESLLAQCPTVEKVILLTDDANMVPFNIQGVAGVKFQGVQSYESFIKGRSIEARWGDFDENTAAGLCYTSGTTGNPKGVLYSHRSNFLHSLSGISRDGLAIGCCDVVMPVVPMFHANCWGLVFDGPATGAKMVMPGPKSDGASLHELIESEGVTFSVGVPTVWQMLLQHLDSTGGKLTTLKRIASGGSAVPEGLLRGFKERYNVDVISVWGMTEISPLGTISQPTPETQALSYDEQVPYRLKGGRAYLGIELKITDDDGKILPHDGVTFGKLWVKGSFTARSYFKQEGGSQLDADGFFDTGDVATIDPYGFLNITDRSKDVIKSGGEWISSIEIENIAVSHPKSAIAAVIGVAHPKWDERPLLLVKLKPGETATKAEYLAYLEGKIAKWWTPDEVLFVDDIPLGATGKIDKKAIRVDYKDYVLPSLAAAAPIAMAADKPEVIYADEPVEEPAAEGETPMTDHAHEPEAPVAEVPPAEAPFPTAETAAAIAEEPMIEAEAKVEEPAAETVAAGDDLGPLTSARDASPFANRAVPLRTKKPVSKTGRLILAAFTVIALGPVVLVGISALLVRLGYIDWQTGYLDMLAGADGQLSVAAKIALISAVTGAIGFFVALFTSPRQLISWSLINIAITAATLGGLYYLYDLGVRSAPVHDVATDWEAPLTFSSSVMAQRGRGSNPVDLDPILPIDTGAYAGRRVMEVNAEVCPGARPVISARPVATAYAAARAAALSAGVQLITDDAEGGRLEGVATSPIYGFKDDVAVRVRQDAAGSRTDIRSISRERDADFGANCARVTRLVKVLG